MLSRFQARPEEKGGIKEALVGCKDARNAHGGGKLSGTFLWNGWCIEFHE